MTTIAFTVLMVGVWGLNLLNGTGLGTAYHTIELSQLAAVALAAAFVLQRIRRENRLLVEQRYFYTYLGMGAVFLLSSWWAGYGLRAWDYLWAYLVVYIFSNIPVRRKHLYLAGAAYAVLGAAILFIFNYMDALDGWNANDIAMIGLFSFLTFIIPYFGARDKQSVFMLITVGVVYCVLLWPTDSRSCIMAIAAALPLIFRILPSRPVLRSRIGIFLTLMVPLAVAVVIGSLAGAPLVEELNEWSVAETGKPAFNGREAYWAQGLELWSRQPLFGGGYLSHFNWHNSAVECLTSYGLVGFGFWIWSFWLPLTDARKYTGDICVSGAMIAFLVIYVQQSVELGFIGRNPNMMPYMILGILVGRVRYLKGKG